MLLRIVLGVCILGALMAGSLAADVSEMTRSEMEQVTGGCPNKEERSMSASYGPCIQLSGPTYFSKRSHWYAFKYCISCDHSSHTCAEPYRCAAGQMAFYTNSTCGGTTLEDWGSCSYTTCKSGYLTCPH